MKYYIGAALLMIGSTAQAGRPYSEEIKCPIGGEKFNITGTGSCSTFGGSQDFLLQVQTSCDFVTKLAQCPSNKLPLYKEFSDEEVSKLEDYIKSDEYKNYQDKSRYLLAYKVDSFLNGTTEPQASNFYLLWNGLKFDRSKTLENEEYMDIFHASSNAKLIEKNEGPENSYIRALLAYTHYYQNDNDGARGYLTTIKANESVKGEIFLQSYVARLEECMASDIKCQSSERVANSEKN